MGKHSGVIERRAQLKSEGGDVSGRHIRAPWSLPLFAGFVSFAFILVTIAPPTDVSSSFAVVAPAVDGDEKLQSLTIGDEHVNSAARDAFAISDVKPAIAASSAPAAGVPDPGTAQAIAYAMMQSMGWGDDQYNCLVALWDRESHWNVYAHNPSSGAYGIPQALPGEKMATAGADWATNPATQITWGLGYIGGRYGSPCGAWAHSEEVGWY